MTPTPAPAPNPAPVEQEKSPEQHYREAERLAHSAATYMSTGRADTASARAIVALAQVHATLALASVRDEVDRAVGNVASVLEQKP